MDNQFCLQLEIGTETLFWKACHSETHARSGVGFGFKLCWHNLLMPAVWVLIANSRTGRREVTQLKKQSSGIQSRLPVNMGGREGSVCCPDLAIHRQEPFLWWWWLTVSILCCTQLYTKVYCKFCAMLVCSGHSCRVMPSSSGHAALVR